jgi:hypothetical protein
MWCDCRVSGFGTLGEERITSEQLARPTPFVHHFPIGKPAGSDNFSSLHGILTFNPLLSTTASATEAPLSTPAMKDSTRPNMSSDATYAGTPDDLGKEADSGRDNYSPEIDDTSSVVSEKQAGVKRIEAVSKSWTLVSLIVAYGAYATPLLSD